MSKRGDKLYLEDILNSIERIEEYVGEMKEEIFYSNKMAIDAVVRNLSIIGEAANNLSVDIKQKNSDVPWVEIIGMRNKIIH